MSQQQDLNTLQQEIQNLNLLLKAGSVDFQVSTQAQTVLHRLNNAYPTDSLLILTAELEELAINLLLRVTTGLDSIRCPELLQVSKNIFRSLSHVKFPPVVASAISELFSKTTDSQDAQEDQAKEETEFRTSFHRDENTFEEEDRGWRVGSHRQGEIKIEAEEEMIFSNRSETISREEELRGISSRFNQKKNHSFCILDISGNFGNEIHFNSPLFLLVLVDKLAETLFEMKPEQLIKTNFFNIMIPFSQLYLRKSMGGDSIFSSLQSGSKAFSYTIYSKRAWKKYLRLIRTFNKEEKEERNKILENQRYSAEEKSLINDDNSIYYKHLQTLTSRVTLIELRFSKTEDLAKLQTDQDIKIKFEHEIFQNKGDESEDIISQPAVLLVTRKAHHIQKFKYQLMQEYDQTIIQLEKKIGMKLRNKSKKKNANDNRKTFNGKRTRNSHQIERDDEEEEEEEDIYYGDDDDDGLLSK